jgi:hypothetical protein
MATYVLPQAQVFQDFTRRPAVAANPLSAHIAGGNAWLVRYADSDERSLGELGLYDEVTENAYAWPNRPVGSKIDQAYTKLFIEDALLEYHADALSSGSMVTVASANRIISDAVNYKTSGAYDRDASLLDRDVQVGDTIRVRGIPTGGSEPITLWTSVRSLIATNVAAVIASATADAANAATQGASVTVTKLSGAENCVAATANGAAFNGLASGLTSETYTITVLDSSVGNDHTTARLRVVSASGKDDVASVTPSADGVATAIGTLGLTVTFAAGSGSACSQSADNENVSPDDLIAGQVWRVVVNQAFTKTTVTSGGTYSRATSTTYIATVTKGGLFAASPEIFVTTTTGADQSGPHIVTGTGVAVTIGTDEVTLTFAASAGLRKGDRFYVEVVGVSPGPVRTIELASNLNEDFEVGDEVGITLYIRKPLLEVTANRVGQAPLTNWEQSDTEITVQPGIEAYDSTWTDGGVPVLLPVISSDVLGYGTLFVEYRSWLPTLVGVVNSLSDVATIDDIPGSLTPDNPLKWGVYSALLNSNGVPVQYSAISDPDDVDAWTEMLELLTSEDGVHGLVPLTRKAEVLNLYKGHVNSASSPAEGLWRTAWFNLQGVSEIPVVSAGGELANYMEATTTDEEPALAVFEDDGETSGSQYTICRVPDSNSAFLTNGVRAGDIVRALYTGDGFGNTSYSEYVVEEVQSENQLRVATGPEAPQSVPAKIEVWRNLSATEEATEIAKAAGAWADRRIRAIWPDRIESGGVVQEGYFLCAALAGLASGVLPQQGLTNVAVAGYTSTQRTNNKFNKAQLDIMAASGTWIVRQSNTGEIYNRHALTTGSYDDINQREEVVTRNVDSISYRFKDYFAAFIGVSNVTPTMQLVIRGGAESLGRTLQQERLTPQLGGQLISINFDSFEVSAVFRDRYVVYASIEVPYALNNIDMHLIV